VQTGARRFCARFHKSLKRAGHEQDLSAMRLGGVDAREGTHASALEQHHVPNHLGLNHLECLSALHTARIRHADHVALKLPAELRAQVVEPVIVHRRGLDRTRERAHWHSRNGPLRAGMPGEKGGEKQAHKGEGREPRRVRQMGQRRHGVHGKPSHVARPSPTEAANLAASLRQRLVALGDSKRADGAKAYLKSDLTFLGVTVPQIRAEARALANATPELDRATLWELTHALWQTRIHELRSVAIALLECRADLLRPSDMEAVAALVRSANTWAHVDWLATKVAGALVTAYPEVAVTLDQWAIASCMWLRRSAMLALHDPVLRGSGDFQHFARLAVPMLGEREFFIQKAIGWMLRSASKRRPEVTEAFVRSHAKALSALSFREATRNLPPAKQARLRALREAP
jgi:3-methyladenine DNA glycosylase AlkD